MARVRSVTIQAMGFRTGGFRVLVALGAAAATFGLSASTAMASDTFFLENDSKTAILDGTSLWGKGNTMPESCRTGPFPGPTETGFTFLPSDKGSITLSQDPFSDCPPGINPLIDNAIEGPGFNGAWVWIPVDPFVGRAHLTCTLLAQTGTRILESTVDDKSCSVADVSNSSSSGTFGSSVAPLRDGKAVAYIQHFPVSGKRRVPYTVTLRTSTGSALGRETVTVAAGKPKRVAVPVTAAIRDQVKENDVAQVRAVVRRADGKRGSGDRTTLSVMRDSEEIPF